MPLNSQQPKVARFMGASCPRDIHLVMRLGPIRISQQPAVLRRQVEDRHEFHDAKGEGKLFGIWDYEIELHFTTPLRRKIWGIGFLVRPRTDYI
jgi:hypothetical protein